MKGFQDILYHRSALQIQIPNPNPNSNQTRQKKTTAKYSQ